MKRLVSTLAHLLLVVPYGAKTITVDNDVPADLNNIQTAINATTIRMAHTATEP